ncbi:MAG: DJ-1/PfpI family protein [Candidatus Methanosuratus sp.]|nr:DJ-1/PfpI family protein [Candidatus Methanosuratincola sp.]
MVIARIIKVGVLAFPDLEELDLTGAWEVLGATRRLFREGVFKDAYFELETIGEERGSIKCYHDLKILAEKTLVDLPNYDVLFVPGGPGRLNAQKDEEILEGVRMFYQSGKVLASVCTGAFILAEAGILRGKRATSFHTVVDQLSGYGACPIRERVVVEGNVVTGAGISSSLDVGLKLVEMLMGKEAAKAVSEWIEYCPSS